MNIPTPTKPDPAYGLDVATLTALANEFFRLLPGEESPTPAEVGHTLSAPPASLPDPQGIGTPTPTLTPAASPPIRVPEPLSDTLPSQTGRASGQTLGVPAAYAAALPQVDVPVQAPVSSPYYFLAEATTYAPPLSQSDRITAQPFHLPGVGDLQAVLGTIALGYVQEPAKTAPSPEGKSLFYFLDTQQVPALLEDHLADHRVEARDLA
ncbi:MAG TPA: hypothetical protein PK530_24910, partial [Anaerolineales bacterium]|nr:hypothetical protein [Anaerolineales bacterium]